MKKNKYKNPPRVAEWLLKNILKDEHWHTPLGDFEEYFNYSITENGFFKSWLWYWGQVFNLIPRKIINSIYWSITLFKNYLKIALRNIKRNKIYSFINISGLAVGMACTILIMLWVQDELDYNQFHKNIENIYWMAEWSRGENCWGSVTALGPALKEDYPEILNFARSVNGNVPFLLQNKEKSFFEEVRIGDFSLFEFFTFPVVNGIPVSGKTDPHVIMISQKMAIKYFGSEDPIGNVLTIDTQYDLKVVGVFKDIPHNSTLRFDIIVPLEFADEVYNTNYSNDWGNDGNQTYLQLKDGIDHKKFNEKIKSFYEKHNKDYRWPVIYPYKDNYLADWGWARGTNVRIFSLVAILILVIACINFMNLSTARSANRAKEVGLRKVIGANRKQLIRQFLSESILFSFTAIVFAFLLVLFILPLFREITGKPLTIENLINTKMLAGMLSIVLITGILSGSYPSLFLSSFSPAVVLKGSERLSLKKSNFRKILVVGQFSISICLIICTLLIYKQVDYLQNAHWGFEKENIVYFKLEGKLRQNYRALKNELLTNPRLINVCATSHTPGGVWYGKSGWEWEGKDPEFHFWSRVFNADPDFLGTFNVNMVEGNFFEKNNTNPHNAVINEEFAKRMKLKDPVGKYIKAKSINDYIPSKITGIIKDYHIAPFNREIYPLIIFPNFKWGENWMNYNYMFIKIRPGNIPETLSHIEQTVIKHNPDYPINCQFFDSYFNRLYRTEQLTDNIIRSFAFLAILISSLGLFGLASFTTEQRRKEIGIRKTLGASITGIMYLLLNEFIRWVIIANIIAIPIAYYFTIKWLENYSYKINLDLWFFIIPGLLALLIAFVTVSHQTIKTALTNPVEALKYE